MPPMKDNSDNKSTNRKKPRQMLTLEGFDGSSVKIPMPKQGFWWTKSHGNRCVVGCKNNPSAVYLSDYGLASYAYCMNHAELQIIKNLIHGTNDRGIWVYCHKGKIKPLWFYKDTIESIKESVKEGKSYMQSLKEIDMKVRGMK